MDVRGGPLTTKQNRVKQKKHALYTWHTHTVPPIQWSRVHHTLVCHCSVLTALYSAHTRTHSPSCTEQGQAGLSCCSSVSYSQGTHTSHPCLPYSRGGSPSILKVSYHNCLKLQATHLNGGATHRSPSRALFEDASHLCGAPPRLSKRAVRRGRAEVKEQADSYRHR